MPQGFWKKKGRGGTTGTPESGSETEASPPSHTGCTDLAAAKSEARRLERKAMAEGDDAEDQAAPHPLGQALTDFIADRERKGRAEGTVGMYKVKAGHLRRLLGAETDVNSYQARSGAELR